MIMGSSVQRLLFNRFVGGAIMGLKPLWTAGIVVVVLGLAFWMLARRPAVDLAGAGVVVAHFAVSVVGTLVLIQAIPYGWSSSNPEIIAEPAWSSPRTRELMVDACFACHSNEVEWPWYSKIAPISWAVTDHVNEGRDAVNYSEFGRGHDDADETVGEILDGSMPPGYFIRFGLHPEADLTDAEVDELVAGLRATPGMSEDDEEDHDEDD